MYHTIEFRVRGTTELELPGDVRITQVLIEKGTRVRAEVKPYVLESTKGPVEVADLLSEQGLVARRVPFAVFRFVDT
jgi:hypothetical protein